MEGNLNIYVYENTYFCAMLRKVEALQITVVLTTYRGWNLVDCNSNASPILFTFWECKYYKQIYSAAVISSTIYWPSALPTHCGLWHQSNSDCCHPRIAHQADYSGRTSENSLSLPACMDEKTNMWASF